LVDFEDKAPFATIAYDLGPVALSTPWTPVIVLES
jgi:hypothetical protein